MNIGIYANEYFIKSPEGHLNRLIINQLLDLNDNYPFFFFANAQYERSVFLPQNANFIDIKTGSGLQKKWFDSLYFPKIIKQYKIDVLIYLQHTEITKAQAMQFLLLHDASVLPKLNDKISKYLSGVIVTSRHLKHKLSETGLFPEQKIFLSEDVENNAFEEPSFDEKLNIRDTYTERKQFFLCSDFDLITERFVFLLKAFSLFKQRLQSSWKLVIALRNKKFFTEIEASLATYKYKNDVVLITNSTPEDLSSISSSAYALVSVSTAEVFPSHIFQALQNHIPVIALKTETNAQYEDAIQLAQGFEPSSIAEKMMLLYKEETLRENFIQKGKDFISTFTTDGKIIALQKWLLQAK